MLLKWKCKTSIYDKDVKRIYDYLIINADDLYETKLSLEDVRVAWLKFGNGYGWKDVTDHNLYLFARWLMAHYRETEGGCRIPY